VRRIVILAATLFALSVPALASAETLAGAHSGDADPISEDWNLDFAGPGASSGPTNDGGILVWSIHDTLETLNSALWYRFQLAPADLAVALASGWRIRAEARAENDPGHGETQFFGFVTGSVAFQVQLRAETNGDMTVRLLEGFPPFSGPTFVVSGGALTYHAYDLASDGASGTASLSIDDVEVHSGYEGVPHGSANGARFGCSTSEATGTIHMKSIELWIASQGAVSVGSGVESDTWGRVKSVFR